MRKATRKYMLVYLVIGTVIGISLVGCSHTPPRPVELDQARTAYAEARDNPRSPAVLQSPYAKLKRPSCAPSKSGIKRRTSGKSRTWPPWPSSGLS